MGVDFKWNELRKKLDDMITKYHPEYIPDWNEELGNDVISVVRSHFIFPEA